MFLELSNNRISTFITYAPINVKPLGGGRPGIGGGFDSSHRPVLGTFDRFNGLSSNILLTFSCYFDNPQMSCGRAFEQKLSAEFKCPAYAGLSPQRLNIDRCNNNTEKSGSSIICNEHSLFSPLSLSYLISLSLPPEKKSQRSKY